VDAQVLAEDVEARAMAVSCFVLKRKGR
jgi:hypothetical protein